MKVLIVSFASFIFINYARASCCQAKEVLGTDARSGRYSFSRDDYGLPPYCTEPCVYTKDNGNNQDTFCFGEGDLSSTCLANVTEDVTAPPGVPDQLRIAPPPGAYLYNSLEGDNMEAVQCQDDLAVLDGDRYHRLDLAALPEASLDTWSTAKLRFVRLDGLNIGTVRYNHLVGLFATRDDDVQFRLNLNIPTTSDVDTSTSRFQIRVGGGSVCSGEVTYNTEYGLFTEDGNNRLDIGHLTSWEESDTSTQLHLVKLQ